MDFQELVALFIISGFHVTSGKLVYQIDFTDVQKDQWVDAHNYYRRNVTDPEAANMRLMTWDDELEEFAKNVVRTCANVHTDGDKLKTSVFPYVGENLYTGKIFRNSELPTREGVTKLWFDEFEFYDYDTKLCDGGECGHYKQLVWAESYKIGCALAQCTEIEKGYPPFLVSCNYGPGGNHFTDGGKEAVVAYKKGEPCTQCGDGDLCIDQLCNNTARDIPFTTTTTEAPTTTAQTTTFQLEAASAEPELSPELVNAILCNNCTSTTILTTNTSGTTTEATKPTSSNRFDCYLPPWPCSGHRLDGSVGILMALALLCAVNML